MKRIIFTLTAILLLLMVFNAPAQKGLKFAHIDTQELMKAMPERETAKKTLEAHAKQLEDQLLAMQKEFENKYNDYLAKADSLADLIRDAKEKELQDLQKRIQAFQQTAQQDLQSKEEKLMQPIIDKAKKAIESVAQEQGFIYVFDMSMGVLLYHSSDSQDILPLVKAKLGIK